MMSLDFEILSYTRNQRNKNSNLVRTFIWIQPVEVWKPFRTTGVSPSEQVWIGPGSDYMRNPPW